MPPHSESMDGPVVNAAEIALDMENVNYILPFVAVEHEGELKEAFERTILVRELSADAAELADYWFFETAVRLHLSGRGKSYDGIKPTGYNRRPALTLAEEALKKENPSDLVEFMVSFMKEDIQSRFEDALSKKDYQISDIESGRDYISSKQDFVRYLDKLYEFMEQG